MPGHSSQRDKRGRGWVRALAGSVFVHAAALGVLGVLGGRELMTSAAPAAVVVEVAIPLSLAEVDLLSPDPATVLPDPPLVTHDEAPPARPLDAPEGDRDEAAARATAPREAAGRDRDAPAPDRGADGGHLPAPVFRRDRSTLRSRLTDGAAESQLPRLRTARRAASPQAIRREPSTGIGDAVASVDPTRLPGAARADAPLAPAPRADGAGPAPGSGVAARAQPPQMARVAERASPDRGVGPLAVEAGARSFDTEARGRATDTQTLRAASSERHPGITDFSHPGVAAPQELRDGRGPGMAPGAVALVTSGIAPSQAGALKPDELAALLALRRREREYNEYFHEIGQRVKRVLVFPRALALRLEQGETVLDFVVRADGALGEGPRVVKSSGFQEFDAEAVKAVLRAAPYPRRAVSTRISMPVTFENPLIR